MPSTYTYIVRDRSGKLQKGSLEAESREAVVRTLRSQNLFVTSVSEVQTATAANSDILARFRSVGVRDLAVFCRQFSIMVSAGVSVLASLDILRDQTSNVKLREAVKAVRDDVERGEALSRAMAKHADVFPSMIVHMVEAGEMGGALEEVLFRLAVHFEKEHELRQKVISALAYPAVVTGVAFLMGLVLMTFVLPMFESMFAGFGANLPAPTRILLAMGRVAQRYWYIVFGTPPLAIVGFLRARRMSGVKAFLDKLSFRVPLFRDLNQKVVVTRLCRALGTMIRNGVPMMQALDVSGKISGNVLVQSAVEAAQEEINRGQVISVPLRESGLFPSMVTHMIAVGEETGSLEEVLDKVASFYDMEVENSIKTLTSLIEPAVMVVLAAAIGFVVISVFLPILDMTAQMSF